MFKNLTIKNSVAALIVIPILAIIYFSATNVYEQIQILNELKPLTDVSELTRKISAHVHEIQKECGVTGGFVGSDGKTFARQLLEQRKLTDVTSLELEEFLVTSDPLAFDNEFDEVLSIAFQEHQKLKEHRGNVDTLSITDDDAIEFYTQHNAKILDIVHEIAVLSPNAEISRIINAYVGFMEAKEKAGVERAVMTRTFAADNFGEGDFIRFTSLLESQNSYFDTFKWYANNNQLNLFEEMMANPVVAEVQRMRDITLRKSAIGEHDGFDVDSQHWFVSITEKIDLMKSVEDKMADELDAKTWQVKEQAQRMLYFNIGLAFITFLSVTSLSVFIGRSISKPIEVLRRGAGIIEKGNLDYKIGFEGGDEIGQLSRAFDKMTAKLKKSYSSLERKVSDELKK